MNIKTTIYKMLTQDTGTHFLDSGGAYGRHWQENKGKTLEDFEASPSATLEVYRWERDGKVSFDFNPTVSLFHHLTECLELDELCREFNALPVPDWNSTEFYGVSEQGEDWLKFRGFVPEGGCFNSYNWNASFSQTIQGCFLDLDGSKYALLQIHGGCDVRGGYTDARLFLISSGETYSVLTEDCTFYTETPDGEGLSVDWSGGEWMTHEGCSARDEDFEKFAETLNLSEDNPRAIVQGFHHSYA